MIGSLTSSVNTEHKRFVEYKNDGYLEPQSISLGSRFDPNPNLAHTDAHGTKMDTVQYVPILHTLSLILSQQEIFNFIHCPPQNSTGCIKSFKDGTRYKQSDFFERHPNALQLLLYNDDIEVANPLGAKASVHKLSMYYFTLANMPSYMNSQLKHIHLAACALSADVARYGHSKILKPLLDDIKLLEKGVEFNLPHGTYTVYGTVVCLVADNLAANGVLGFVESFSANYYCRFCKMSKTDCQDSCRQSCALLRFTEDHTLDVATCDVAKTGVKAISALDCLSHFESVESFTPDVMHDILEGSAKIELCKLLTQFIDDEKLFTLNQLNSQISTFHYG
jgi:hypothetical protein